MSKIHKVITRQKIWLTLVGILILVIFSGLISYPQLPLSIPGESFFSQFKPHLGLDLQGGAHLVYQADVSELPAPDQDSALEGVRDVIERRVNAFGVSEPIVQTGSNHRLIIELAGIHDVNDAIQQIGETPLLEFKTQLPSPPPVALTETEKQEAIQFNLDIYNKAKGIISELEAGADFSELAGLNSEDTSNKDLGGELGFAGIGMFVPEFEKAIFEDLHIGEITSEPIKTDFGYHIIKKIAEQGEGDEKEVNSAHILLSTKDEEYKQAQILNSDQWQNTQLSGKHLQKAIVQFDPNTNAPNIGLEFNSEGRDLFAEITKGNIGKPVAIFLDGYAISIPTVKEEITGGSAVISGNFNLVEAKELAQRLNAGALPIPIHLISQQTVGPSLGKISLEKSLIAGLLGLIIVALFMIIYYRLPGIISVIALLMYGIFALAVFEVFTITLTLAGIACFILSVGMAVDANLLIFERTKEELRSGKPIGNSIEEGFSRAWLSIRDSNISSIITCIILAWFGSSLIKGFAITLGIGILISMFSAFVVTKTLLRLFATKFFAKHPFLFGVKKKKENV